jgi:hypothetical protein
MQFALMRSLAMFSLLSSLLAAAQVAGQPQSGGDFSTNLNPTEKQKVPEGVLIVKGAWSSASDAATPLPEGGSITSGVFSDPYFSLSYTLPAFWAQKHNGPPPSDSGHYVLALITPTATYKGPARGSILITAQDMFFTPVPANNALELVNYTKDNLQADYQVEIKPTETKIAGQSFTFFAYWSPAAELHWYVFATEIRCHTLELVLTSRDTKLLESLVLDLNKMKLPEEAGPTAGKGGGAVPLCVKDYANEEHVIERVEPVFLDRKFNSVPVRIIIDRQGKIKQIHFLSAFPDQAKAITDALGKWRFRPYLKDGKPVEVETGIMFGRGLKQPAPVAISTQD